MTTAKGGGFLSLNKKSRSKLMGVVLLFVTDSPNPCSELLAERLAPGSKVTVIPTL